MSCSHQANKLLFAIALVGVGAAFLIGRFLGGMQIHAILLISETVILACGYLCLVRVGLRFREAEMLRQSLTNAIVHDLKNPMNTILASISSAIEDPLSRENRMELLNIARRGCRNLITITDNLLDVSRMESPLLRLNIEQVDVAELLALCMTEIDIARTLYGVNIRIADVSSLLPFNGDKYLIQRMLANLMHNAIQYTPSGGEISLAISFRENEKAWLFQLRDSGPEIPEKGRNKIFEKFYRVEGSGQGNRKGAGIGLYFCYLVAKAHNGRINVDSEPGGGTTFSILIPAPPFPNPRLCK